MLRGWRCRAVTNRGYCSLIRASRPHTHAYRQVLMLMLHSLSLTQAAERSGSRIKCSDSDSDAPECWALLDIPDTYTQLHTYICMHAYKHTNKRTYKRVPTTYECICMYIQEYLHRYVCIKRHGYIQTHRTYINALAVRCDSDCQATQPQKLENQIKIQIQRTLLLVSSIW